MPVYEYECPHCFHRFELKQSFDAAPAGRCPRCAGTARRLFSAVGVVFKGRGFYATDSRPQKNGEEKAESTAPAASSEAKKETPAPQGESAETPS